jgi:hypothetical protein
MSKLKIVAAVVDTTEVILYKEDGSTVSILQGDPRITTIVEQVLPIVEKGGVAEVDLSVVTSFAEFEEQANGFVRFFRMAKELFTATMNQQHIPDGQFGPVPGLKPSSARAVSEIIANAEPARSDKFQGKDLGPDETVVAVVETDTGPVAIPGAEALHDQFQHSARNRDTVGMKNLLARLAKMIDQRQHSVEDLLRFLERADLPIADDGSIIAYKILRHKVGSSHVFVDCHTRKVPQKVGSYVCVSEDLVDKNRRNECSNGLHVARRGYIGTFGGDTVTLIKVAPEDVIVVPHNDANKVRVCGYHIIAELPTAAYNLLKSNKPMTSDRQIAKLLGDALAGRHVERLEEVRITKQRGEGVFVSPLVNGKPVKKAKSSGERTGLALDDPTLSKVNPQDVAAQVAARKGNGNGSSRQARALELLEVFNTSTDPQHRYQAATGLVAHKRASKVSWDSLGINAVDVLKVTQTIEAGEPAKAPTPPAPKAASKPKATQSLPAPKAAPVVGTRQEKAAALLGVINSTASAVERGLAAVNLINLKRTSKVSWDKLGVTLTEEQLKKIAHAGESAAAEAEEKAKSTPASKPAPKTKAAPKQPVVPVSRSDQARAMFKAKQWAELKAFKQKAKIGWFGLGFTQAEVVTITNRLAKLK